MKKTGNCAISCIEQLLSGFAGTGLWEGLKNLAPQTATTAIATTIGIPTATLPLLVGLGCVAGYIGLKRACAKKSDAEEERDFAAALRLLRGRTKSHERNLADLGFQTQLNFEEMHRRFARLEAAIAGATHAMSGTVAAPRGPAGAATGPTAALPGSAASGDDRLREHFRHAPDQLDLFADLLTTNFEALKGRLAALPATVDELRTDFVDVKRSLRRIEGGIGALLRGQRKIAAAIAGVALIGVSTLLAVSYFRRDMPRDVQRVVSEENRRLADEIVARMRLPTTQPGMDALRSENDDLKRQLAAALARAEQLESAGGALGEAAKAALAQAREELNGAKLDALLDQLLASWPEKRHEEPDYLELLRESASVAYVRGEIDKSAGRLETILRIDPDDRDAINRMGHIHRLRGRLDEAERAYRRVVELSVGDESWQAAAYGNLGNINIIRGDLNQAEAMHRMSLELDEKLGRREGMAIAYGNLGLIYQTRGDLNQAEAMQRKSLKLNEKLGKLVGKANAYGNLGVIYRIHGDLDQAETMLRKSLELNERLGRLEGMAAAYGNLGLIYETRGDLDQAEAMQRKSLEIGEKLGWLAAMADSYVNLGGVLFTRGNLVQAAAMLRKSLELNEKLGRREGMAITYANLGNIAKQRGRLADARRHWERSRDMFAKLGNKGLAAKVQGWIDGLGDKGR